MKVVPEFTPKAPTGADRGRTSPEKETSPRTFFLVYLAFGVAYVWVIDPISNKGEIYTRERFEKITDGQFTAGEIRINLNLLD